MAPCEPADDFRQMADAMLFRDADPEPSCKTFTADLGASVIQRLDNLAGNRKKGLPCLGKPDASSMSSKDRFPEQVFKLPYLQAHRRLGAMNGLRAAGHTTGSGNGKERAQEVAIEVSHTTSLTHGRYYIYSFHECPEVLHMSRMHTPETHDG